MPRLNKDSGEESLEVSPLLMNMDKPMPLAGSRKSRFNSTINPEKFDMARFSTRVEEEENESSFRIILYVVAVIVVGVGLALFVKFFITKDENNANDNTDTEQTDGTTNQELTTSAVNISIAPKSDESASKTTLPYAESELASLGSSTIAAGGTSVVGLTYSRHTTFAQAAISLEGLNATKDLPQIAITFNKSSDVLTVKFPTETTLATELMTEININDIVTSINYDSSNNALNFKFREDSSYRIFIDNGKVMIDVKTAAQITKEADTATMTPPAATPPVTPPTTTTPPAATAPTTKNYANDFSKNKQFIVSDVTTKAISYNEIYYTDSVSNFELAFGMRNNVGDNFVPNAEAELVKENGINYIDITIKNLSGILFTSDNVIDQSDMGISLATANFVRADLKSFDAATGIAKVRIQLKNEADFRLVSEPTVSGQTQVLAIQIKD